MVSSYVPNCRVSQQVHPWTLKKGVAKMEHNRGGLSCDETCSMSNAAQPAAHVQPEISCVTTLSSGLKNNYNNNNQQLGCPQSREFPGLKLRPYGVVAQKCYAD